MVNRNLPRDRNPRSRSRLRMGSGDSNLPWDENDEIDLPQDIEWQTGTRLGTGSSGLDDDAGF